MSNPIPRQEYIRSGTVRSLNVEEELLYQGVPVVPGGGGGGGQVDSVVAGTGISVDSTDPVNPIVSSTVVNTDQVAKVSANDTTAGYLNGKLVAGANITLTEGSDGGNETLTIAASGGGGGGGGFTFYDVTLADAENNAAAVDIASITIPANSWEDGQSITFDIGYDLPNFSGSFQNPTIYFNGTGINGFLYTGSWGSNGQPRRQWIRMTLFRSGSDVFTDGKLFGTTGSYLYPLQLAAMAYPSLGGGIDDVWKDSGVNFAVDITVKYRITLNAANASYWLRPWYGSAWKTEKGASL